MSEKFAIRGISSQFKDAYGITTEFGAVPQPTDGGIVFIANNESAFGDGSAIIAGFDYDDENGSCTIEGNVYTIDRLEADQAFIISRAEIPWIVNENGEVERYIDNGCVLSLIGTEQYFDVIDYEWYEDENELWSLGSRYLSPNEPEITPVYYKGSGTSLSQGELGYKILGDGPMGICVSSREDIYYGDDEEGFDADWTTEAPDEAVISAYFGGAPITIPEGFYVIDVKCKYAFTFTSNKTDQTSNVWSAFHIGEYGEFGLDNGMPSQGVIKFGGTTPILTIFAITTVNSNASYSGYRLSYKSTDSETDPHGTSISGTYYDFKNRNVESYSSFLFFNRLVWSSDSSGLSNIQQSPYPWMFTYDGGTSKPISGWPKDFPFSLPRSLWSVSYGTLTWNGDTESKTDIAYYYKRRNVRIMLSKTNMSEVREAYARSAANQYLTANLANGASSSMYEITKSTVLTATEGTRYKVIQLVGAEGAFISTNGISLSVAPGGAVKITNNSGATVAWLKVRYREILS